MTQNHFWTKAWLELLGGIAYSIPFLYKQDAGAIGMQEMRYLQSTRLNPAAIP